MLSLMRPLRRAARTAPWIFGVLALAMTATPALAESGWLGVNLQPLDDDLREAMGLDRRVRGALVTRVLSGSPADDAGLRADDVIVEVDGRRIESVEEAVDAVRAGDAGDEVRVVVNRRGSERGLTVELGSFDRGERSRADRKVRVHRDGDDDRDVKVFRWKDGDEEPFLEWRGEDDDEKVMIVRPKRFREDMREHAEKWRDMARGMAHHFEREEGGAFLGVTTQSLGGQLAEHFGVDEGEGVLVSSVVEDSAAEDAGLRAGDVILAVENEEIDSPESLRRAVRDHEPGDAVDLRIVRDGRPETVTVTLGESEGSGFRWFDAPDAPEAPEVLVVPRTPRAPGAPEMHELHRLPEELHEHLAPRLRELEERRGEIDRLAPRMEELNRELEMKMRDLERKLEEMERKLREMERDSD